MEKDKRKFGFFSAEAYPSSKLSAAVQSSGQMPSRIYWLGQYGKRSVVDEHLQ